MRERYLEKLNQLSKEVLDMGLLCEQAIMKTYRLLVSNDLRSEQVEEINHMEKEIDEREHSIESVCMQLLLRQQPVASDLRRISAALKMVTDMERIGDQATDIGEILETGSIDVPVEGIPIARMAEFGMNMVNKAVEAYISSNPDLAEKVIESDDVMDKMFAEVRRLLDENPMNFSSDQILDLLMIAKYYERIGDHAANIGEWAEFSINGIHRSGEGTYDVFALNN